MSMVDVKEKKLVQLISPALFIRPERIAFPYTWVGHIPFAAWIVAMLKPEILVELGTHSGNSYLAFCQAVHEHEVACKCYAVDVWGGDEHAGYYEDNIFKELSAYHDARYKQFSRLMKMTFDEALGNFADGSVDLLHIDGLHTYEAVKHDFDTWLPKMSDRGVVMFHDISIRESGFGVWKLWAELKEKYPNIEFEHSNGLGVIVVGKDLPPEFQQITSKLPSSPDIIFFKSAAKQLGDGLLARCELELVLAERDKLINSTSWAVTRPIRWFGNLLSGLMR